MCQILHCYKGKIMQIVLTKFVFTWLFLKLCLFLSVRALNWRPSGLILTKSDFIKRLTSKYQDGWDSQKTRNRGYIASNHLIIASVMTPLRPLVGRDTAGYTTDLADTGYLMLSLKPLLLFLCGAGCNSQRCRSPPLPKEFCIAPCFFVSVSLKFKVDAVSLAAKGWENMYPTLSNF